VALIDTFSYCWTRREKRFLLKKSRASNQPLKNVSRGAAEKVSWGWWYANQIAAFRQPILCKR